MQPYSDNSVNFRMMLAGYRGAAGRYHAGHLTQDVAATYHPLFEALNWAVALGEQAGARWSPRGEPLGSKWRDEIDGGDLELTRFGGHLHLGRDA